MEIPQPKVSYDYIDHNIFFKNYYKLLRHSYHIDLMGMLFDLKYYTKKLTNISSKDAYDITFAKQKFSTYDEKNICTMQQYIFNFAKGIYECTNSVSFPHHTVSDFTKLYQSVLEELNIIGETQFGYIIISIKTTIKNCIGNDKISGILFSIKVEKNINETNF